MTGTGGSSGASVLVVDDADDTRLVFADWLRGAGHTVVEARTGAEAIERLSRSRFDLAVVDVQLPDLPGLDVCDRIKANRATASIPVLLVSASAIGPNDRSTALNRGADGYLIQPIERDELLATVTSLLRYHDARGEAERLATRLERLHQATLLMNAAPTMTELLQFAGTGLTSIFGTTAAVLVTRDGVGRIAVATTDQLEPDVRECPSTEVVALAGTLGSGPVTGVRLLDELLGPDRAPAMGAPVATPQGETVGAVLVLREQAPPEDELMLDHFAQALAVALENQRLYSLEHQIALTLQRAMLPPAIPRPDHLEIAVRYQAASDTIEVGGDFYEAVSREGVTVVAVGDVAGHSLQAATVMAELRHALRAFASLWMPLPDLVERLGTTLHDSHPGLTATLCLAEIHRTGRIRIANAGHLPPVLRDADGTRLIDEHGPLLGLRSFRPTPIVDLPFGPGSTLLLASDGLVERRREDIDVGLERLRRSVEAHDGDAESLCDRVLRDVSAGADTFDDVAILVARGR